MRRIAEGEGVIFRDFFLKRHKVYNPNGRYETEEQAKAIDVSMEKFLNDNSIPYNYIDVPKEERNQVIISKLIPFHSFQPIKQ
jgi:hypothetical protein